MIARRNREKKKALFEETQAQCEALAVQNEQLGSENGNLRNRVRTLQEEVTYLKSVLANQSALAHVLSSLPKGHDQLRFSTSFDAEPSPAPSSSGGVCLHVDGKNLSLELCNQCAKFARGGGRK